MKYRAYILSFVLGAASVAALSALNEPDPSDRVTTVIVEASPDTPVRYMFMLSGQSPEQGTATKNTQFTIPGLQVGVLSAQAENKKKVNVHLAEALQGGKPENTNSGHGEYFNIVIHGKDKNMTVF